MVGATLPIAISLPPPSLKSKQSYGFAIFSTHFVMVHAMDMLPAPLVPPYCSPTICRSHNCFNRWTAGTKCPCLHSFTGSWLTAIWSSHSHDHIFHSLHLTKYIHHHSIYFWPASAVTSNCLHSSISCSWAVQWVIDFSAQWITSLQVKTSYVGYHLSSLQALLHPVMPVDKTPGSVQF